MSVPASRVRVVVDRPLRRDGDYVLYWMIGARRAHASFALDRALAHAAALRRPLLVFEPLRVDYRWASDRMHRFVTDGMAVNAAAYAAAGVTYYPYVEPAPGAGRGLLAALAARAAVVVTDLAPGFFLPRMVAAAAAHLDARLEEVDGVGLLPLGAHGRPFATAAAFRWHWHKVIGPHLAEAPHPAPLAKVPRSTRDAEVPAAVLRRWPAAPGPLLAGRGLDALPIDHLVAPVPYRGGSVEAAAALTRFVDERLARYQERNQPEADSASGLSPYLHFGHAGAHQILDAVWRHAGWDPGRVIGQRATGRREGWWGLPAPVEGFLDELVTWRELGHGFCHLRDDFDQYESLPPWAQATLDAHADDPRPHLYTLAELDRAATHDAVWNAAQRQLVAEGRIHNYLRMLWGKKILEWSASPRAALAALIELNNRYAVDGRDPNSYAGIFWTLGRFDRPWAPKRPIFGSIRYMSSDATVKKLRMKGYLARWSAQPGLPL